MARRTPAAERTVAVLNFLAANRDRRYSLSDLARELDLNKATAHALLATLVDAAFLVRDEDEKTYTLGPAVIPLGAAARVAFPAVALAEQPMQEVADELELQCVASADIDDHIVILSTSGLRRPIGINIEPGLRIPLLPPLGAVFVAWADERRVQRWLDGMGPDATDADRDRQRDVLRVIRERGYSIGLGGEGNQRMVESLRVPERRHRRPGAPADDYSVIDLGDTEAYRVSQLGAPVFDQRGQAAMALFLFGFDGLVAGRDIPVFAERLLAAAEQVTTALRGRVPVVT